METRQEYTAPIIEKIVLDNEISLALESDAPPAGPDEVNNNFPESFTNSPFDAPLA